MAKSDTAEQAEETAPKTAPVAPVKVECPTTAGRPESEQHQNVKVYRTDLRTRYCKCNDCGANWKIAGPMASPVAEFLQESAAKLEESCKLPQTINDQPCIVIPVVSAKRLAKRMRVHAQELTTG